MGKNLTTKINWDLLAILILGKIVLEQTFFFVISFVYLIFILYKNHFKIKIPNVPGLKIYIFLILINFIFGMFTNDLRSVFRDVYYFAPTIIWIFIGCNYHRYNQNRNFEIYKTLCLFGFISSISAFISFFISGDMSFSGIRLSFTTGVYDVGFIFAYLVLESVYFNKYAFSKNIDYFFLLVMGLHIALSLGRISIGLPIISIIVMSVLLLKKKNSLGNLKRVMFPFCIIIVLAVFAINFIPKDVLVFFTNKILYSMTEINANQVINSTELAMNNWRGYENQVALQQWKNCFFVNQLFGSGLGTGIVVHYVPYSWVNMLVDNKLPLLHNGYFTALIKIGLVGMASLIAMFILPIIKYFKKFKSALYNTDIYIEIITMSIMALIFTFIVRGPIQQGIFLIWAILAGSLTQKN